MHKFTDKEAFQIYFRQKTFFVEIMLVLTFKNRRENQNLT